MEPIKFVDTLFGVGSSTSAGPTLPSGSIHPSPETLDKDCGGYYRNQPIIGFGQAYTSGAGGTKCYGNFLLAPISDKPELCAEKCIDIVVPSAYGKDTSFASGIVLVSHLLSCITIPIIFFIFDFLTKA